jgi:hypothetical protein
LQMHDSILEFDEWESAIGRTHGAWRFMFRG